MFFVFVFLNLRYITNALQMREMIVERKMEEAAAIEEAREEAEREAMYRRLVQASGNWQQFNLLQGG